MAEENKGFHPVKAFKDKIDKNKKFLKGLTMGLVAGIIVTAAIAVAIALRPDPVTEPADANGPDTVVMLSQISQISELATVEQSYTICEKVTSTNRLFDMVDIPFTENWFILAYNATLKAGINLEHTQVRVEGTTVYVTIPDAQILSNEIHTDSFKVLHEQNNIFNDIEVADVTSYIDQSRCDAEAAALEGDLLDKAESNAKDAIVGLISPTLPEGYAVEFTSPSADTAAEAE